MSRLLDNESESVTPCSCKTTWMMNFWLAWNIIKKSSTQNLVSTTIYTEVIAKIKLSLCLLVIVHKTYYTESTGIRSVDAQMSHGIIFTCQTVPTHNNFQHVLIQVLMMHTCLYKTYNLVSTGSQAQVEHPGKLAMSMVMYNTAHWNKEHFINHISLKSQYVL